MERVISTRFPYLPVRLLIGQATHRLEVLLDTGFDGAVAIPPAWIEDAGPPFDYISWTLADGSTLRAAAYFGLVQLGTLPPFSVLVTALGDEPLAGRGVSDRFSITLDHGQRVVVEA
jgi:predicted aspartyl protease